MAWRVLGRQRAYSAINIAGLAVGLTGCLLVFLFVQDELGYDRYHDGADSVYRLRVERFANGGEEELTAAASAPMLPAVLKDHPQVSAGTRIHKITALVEVGDRRVYEEKFFWADPGVFDVFSWPLTSGDPATALVAPNSVVLTSETARRYFGTEDPLGKTLTIEKRDVTVTGVLAKIPAQTHFSFDFLGSYSTWESIARGDQFNWWGLRYYTYLRLDPGASVDALAESIREMPSRYVGDEEKGSGYRQFLYLQPLSDIHLRSHYKDEIEPNGDIDHVYIFSVVAIFILIIATINFMNLATARSAQRAREVGLRKVVGAQKGQLILQFLGESVVLAFLSLALAVILLYLTLPMFNGLSSKSFSIMDLSNPAWILGIVAFAFVTGIFSGSYPAFVISAFQPIMVLKGQVLQGSGAWLRKGLVVFQFVISIALIISSFTVFDQLSFMKNRDLGFEKEQILIINANNHDGMRSGYLTFKQQMGALPDIQQTSMASTLPGKSTFRNQYVIRRTTMPDEDGQTMLCPAVDHDIVASLGLDVIAGRGFSEAYSTDAEGAYLINETALRALGWTDPEDAIGQELTRQFSETRVIVGVIKDFHFRSLQHAMEPMVLRVDPSQFNYVILRIDTRDIVQTVASVETAWNSFSPDRPMESFFLNDDYNKQYRSEERVGSLLTVFTGLAIFVACLGLFGLTSFTTQQRLKEIGVRKVLGASVASLVFMLARNVTGPVLLAMAVAMPLAFLGMRRWLEAFAYRTEPSIETFLIAGILSLGIAWLTVGYQSVRSALANPVSALRDG